MPNEETEETVDDVIARKEADRRARKKKEAGTAQFKLPLTDHVYDDGIRRVDLDKLREIKGRNQ